MVGVPVGVEPQRSGKEHRRFGWIVFVGCAVLAIGVGVGVGLNLANADEDSQSAQRAAVQEQEGSPVAPNASAVTTPAAPDTAQTARSTPNEPPPTRPPQVTTEVPCVDDGSWLVVGPATLPPTPCPASPNGTPSLPEDTSLTTGWVVLVDAEAIDNPHGIEAIYQRAAALGLSPRLLDSRRYLGLRDPYWTVVVGPLPSEADVEAWCAANWSGLGSDDGSCKARRLEAVPPSNPDD